MKSCTYTYNGKTYNSYNELAEEVKKLPSDSLDTLFSQKSPQEALCDEINKIKIIENFNYAKSVSVDSDVDINTENDNTFTTQTFIDSEYFSIHGNTPMFRLSTEEYVETMKKQKVSKGKMTPEQAEAWGNAVQTNWNKIADAAIDFHRICMSTYNSNPKYWEELTNKTVFSEIPDKIQEIENKIYWQVMGSNYRDKTGQDKRGTLFKNINLKAEIDGVSKDIIGHVDYLVVTPEGNIEIYNIKTSSEPYDQWSAVKKEKYKYQVALLKQIFASKGIDPNKIRVNIIPVAVKYDEKFEKALDVTVHDYPISYDTYDMKYSLKQQDEVAKHFIKSQVNYDKIELSSLVKATATLQKIFPGSNIHIEGIRQSARKWIDDNWSLCNPDPQPGGGYKLTLPDGTGDVITVKDSRVRAKNEEFVEIIARRMDEESSDNVDNVTTQRLYDDLIRSFRLGYFNSTLKGKVVNHIEAQFTKYFAERTETVKENGDEVYDYKWRLIDSPALRAAGIIAFEHKGTHQLDVFSTTAMDIDGKFSLRGGNTNLLGAYLYDINDEGFTLPSTYGNMEAVRVMALLNEVLPDLEGDIKLGQLKILALNPYTAKKGAYFEFDSLLKEWNTIIKVVNNNNPEAKLENNFKRSNIECVAPEVVLYQAWSDIMDDSTENYSEISRLSDVLDERTLADGTVEAGLMKMSTIEGKLEKLQELIDRLQKIADNYGMNYSDVKQMMDLQYSPIPSKAAVAKLYILATKALNTYYGDIKVSNQEFGAIEEYGTKATSSRNENYRQVAYLISKTIDTIRDKIIKSYQNSAEKVFRTFYDQKGYSNMQNLLVGNQKVVFDNLYQVDENGKNLFLFKNPYDDSNNLTSDERTFLKKILFEMYKVRCSIRNKDLDVTGINDPILKEKMPENYLYVPLQRASSATRNANILNSIEQSKNRLARMLKDPALAFEEAEGFLDSKDVRDRDLAIEEMRVFNPYLRSEISLNERSKFIQSRGEGYFETNLESIFIDFLSRDIQCKEFNKLLIRIKGIEMFLRMREMVEGDTKNIDHTVKAIDDYVTVNIHNKSLMSEGVKKVDTFVAPFRRLVSKMYIALNPVAAVRDTLQGFQGNFLSAAIKYRTNIDASDVAYGYGQVFTKGSSDTLTMNMLNQFNVKYGFSNFDAAYVAERLKTNRYGVLNAGNMAYATLRMPDYLNRMTLFMANLHHDGAHEAYSLNSEGRLEYDWRKDKRFSVYASGNTNHPEYNKQKAFYMSMIRMFNTEDPSLQLAYTDDLPDAYTFGQIRAMKSLGDTLYGAYDKAAKTKLEYVALGRNFMFFTTWMNGIVDAYWKPAQKSETELKLVQETDYNGNPLFFTADGSGNTTTEDTGNPVYKYTPMMVQGVLQTFGDVIKLIKNNATNPSAIVHSEIWSNPVNRKNFVKFFSDMGMWLIFAMLFKMAITPWYKEHKKESDGDAIIINYLTEVLYKASKTSYDVFKGPFNVIEYLGTSTNPASYKLQEKLVIDLGKVVMGKKTFGQFAMGTQALLRSGQDTYKMWLRENKPASTEKK